MTAANAVNCSVGRPVDNFDPEWAHVCPSGDRNLEQTKLRIAKRCDPRRLRTVRPLGQQSETRVGQDEQSLRVVVSKLSWAVASLVLGHDRALTPCGVRTPVDELDEARLPSGRHLRQPSRQAHRSGGHASYAATHQSGDDILGEETMVLL